MKLALLACAMKQKIQNICFLMHMKAFPMHNTYDDNQHFLEVF